MQLALNTTDKHGIPYGRVADKHRIHPRYWVSLRLRTSPLEQATTLQIIRAKAQPNTPVTTIGSIPRRHLVLGKGLQTAGLVAQEGMASFLSTFHHASMTHLGSNVYHDMREKGSEAWRSKV
jgi:hypothetical protein